MLSRQPSMRAIEALEAAARHESFARAAKELNLTQSAISHAIRGLESQIGTVLFRRRGPTLELTREGRALAERVRVGLRMLSLAIEETIGDGRAARLVVAAPGAFAQRVIVRRLRDAGACGGPSIDLRTDLGIRDLETGEADICVVRGPTAPPGLAARVIAWDQVFPVAAPDRVQDARGFPDVDLVENLEHPWATWFGQMGGPPMDFAPRLTVADWALALDAAQAGIGVALACEALVHDELSAGHLVKIGAANAPRQALYQAVWAPIGAKRSLVEAFVDVIAPPAAHPSGPPLALVATSGVVPSVSGPARRATGWP